MLLKDLQASEWTTDAHSGSEELIEVAGRMCYKAFPKDGGGYLNKNLTKTREGNRDYINNILKQKHGSVLEHASVTFAIRNVSRVVTHELVRHRAGTAFSQESGRFVRIDDIGMYFPKVFTDEVLDEMPHINPWVDEAYIRNKFKAAITKIEETIAELSKDLNLDSANMLFSQKKKLTSALRRLAPNGQANDIVVTANHRAWRHMISMRTSPGAEEEIVDVFHQIGTQLKEHFPAIYQDMYLTEEPLQWAFENEKV